MSENNDELIGLSAMIVSAYVAHNNVTRSDLISLIESTHAAMERLNGAPAAPVEEPLVPAVSIKKSITPEAIICLEDGKSFKTLKRHLSTTYGMTPEQYRTKWSLPADYPMVAPAYAEKRSALARSMGLGRKPGESPKKSATRKKA